MSFYGLLIGIAFVLGINLISKRNKVIPKNKENIFFILLFIFSLIGARIYFVLGEWSYYSQNLIEILNTRNGGLGIFGGLLFGILFVFIFSKINKISFLRVTNLIIPFVSLGQSIGRWGNYINTEVFGVPTKTNFGQFIPQTLRPIQFQNYSFFHPVWFYESILDLILFIFLFRIKKNQTAFYLIGYGIIRFFMEFLRWDTWQINGFKVSQIISLILVIIGLISKKPNILLKFKKTKEIL